MGLIILSMFFLLFGIFFIFMFFKLHNYIYLLFGIIAIFISFKQFNYIHNRNNYFNALTNIKADNVLKIEINGKYEIKNRNKINNLIFSLLSSKLTDKTYSNGNNPLSQSIKIYFKDKSFLLLELMDYNHKNNEVYIFIKDWKHKKADSFTITNLVIKNNQLKSVLKDLNLPNRKEKQASNGN